MLRPVRYTILFALPLVVAASLLGVSHLVLQRLGEDIDPVTAARIQQTADISYSSALFYRPRPYKLERARLAKADTVLLGSSRAMQFVKDPWKTSVINAGGAMRDIESGEIFADRILDVYHPKRIILALDWWWFSVTRDPDSAGDVNPKTEFTLHELVQPAVWIWDGSLSASNLNTLLFHSGALPPAIGLPAHFSHAGWDSFGHYDYGDLLSEQAGGPDVGFEETFEDLQHKSKGNDRAPANGFSEASWQRFEALIKRFQDSGAEVIVFLPPVAGPVHDWLAQQPEPNIVNEVQRRLPTLPALTFDFHDPTTIGSDPCEFVDGIHGGEVSYLRVLHAIAADPSADLENDVDQQAVEKLIAANAGHASLKRDDRTRQPEADFNSLGCRK